MITLPLVLLRGSVSALVVADSDNPSNVKVSIPCTKCGQVHDFSVPFDRLEAYHLRRMHVQDAFPEMSAGDREMFVSGLCDSCFNALFSESED